MNELEKKVLRLLADDARLTPELLSAMLGEEIQKVKEAVEKLENQGVIVKYFTLLNKEKINEEEVEALIEVKVLPQKQNGFDAIAKEIEQLEQVKSVFLMSGAYDLLVSVVGKNIKDVAMFVAERLSVMENVQSTATHFVLKKYKVEGVSMENDGDARLKIQL